jgi:hypothetical protein
MEGLVYCMENPFVFIEVDLLSDVFVGQEFLGVI